MSNVMTIGFDRLAYMLIPLVVVLFLYWRVTNNWKDIVYGTFRMVSQLVLVGFALNIVFETDNVLSTCLIFFSMLLAAAWIATRKLHSRKTNMKAMAYALAIGSIPVLFMVMIFVLPNSPWYKPNYFIPLAGMILSNGMNSLALAADKIKDIGTNRLSSEHAKQAFETALIPTINSFFAVGIVSLPGMMTGQILSGVSPLIAVRYQIVVMFMILSSSGICTAFYLLLMQKKLSIN